MGDVLGLRDCEKKIYIGLDTLIFRFKGGIVWPVWVM